MGNVLLSKKFVGHGNPPWYPRNTIPLFSWVSVFHLHLPIIDINERNAHLVYFKSVQTRTCVGTALNLLLFVNVFFIEQNDRNKGHVVCNSQIWSPAAQVTNNSAPIQHASCNSNPCTCRNDIVIPFSTPRFKICVAHCNIRHLAHFLRSISTQCGQHPFPIHAPSWIEHFQSFHNGVGSRIDDVTKFANTSRFGFQIDRTRHWFAQFFQET